MFDKRKVSMRVVVRVKRDLAEMLLRSFGVTKSSGKNILVEVIHDELLKRGYIVTRAQLAYHLGLLRNSRLISNEFKREGQIFSRYKLTEIGKKILEGIEKAIE